MLEDLIAKIVSDQLMQRAAFSDSLSVGKVSVIEKRGYRLEIGKDDQGKPVLSNWYPHPETGKTWSPLKKGQTVGVINPHGNSEIGFILPAGYSKDAPFISADLEANVFEDAGVRIEIKNKTLMVTTGALVMTASDKGFHVTFGESSIKLTGGGIATTGGYLTHNGKDVGHTHQHGNVTNGPSITDPPV